MRRTSLHRTGGMPTWQELAGQQGAATCGSINEEFAWAVKTLIRYAATLPLLSCR